MVPPGQTRCRDERPSTEMTRLHDGTRRSFLTPDDALSPNSVLRAIYHRQQLHGAMGDGRPRGEKSMGGNAPIFASTAVWKEKIKETAKKQTESQLKLPVGV